MPKAFRNPHLEAPSQRVVTIEARRPAFCFLLSFMVTLIVGVVFAFSAWNLRVHTFDSKKLEFHDGDEVATSVVAKDFSSIFCDEYQVTAWDHLTVYQLPDKAKVNSSDIMTIPVDFNDSNEKFNDVRAFYLLPGSSIVIDACRKLNGGDTHSDVCIIKGQSKFRLYRDRDDHPSWACAAHHDVTDHNTCASNNSTADPVHIRFDIDTSDTYYLIVNYRRSHHRRHHRHPHDDVSSTVNTVRSREASGIKVNGSVTRTRYATSRSEDVCTTTHQNPSCSFQLPWKSGKDLVIEMRSSPGQEEHEHSRDIDHKMFFTTNCNLRVFFWVCVFGGVPLLISGAMAAFFGCLFCRKRRRNLKSVKRQAKKKAKRYSEKTKLVENEVIPEDGGGSMAIQDE